MRQKWAPKYASTEEIALSLATLFTHQHRKLCAHFLRASDGERQSFAKLVRFRVQMSHFKRNYQKNYYSCSRQTVDSANLALLLIKAQNCFNPWKCLLHARWFTAKVWIFFHEIFSGILAKGWTCRQPPDFSKNNSRKLGPFLSSCRECRETYEYEEPHPRPSELAKR